MKVYIEKIPKEPLYIDISIVPEIFESEFIKDEILKNIENKVADAIINYDTDYAELKKYSLELIEDNMRTENERNCNGFMAKQFQNKLIELIGFDNYLKFENVCSALMRQQDWYQEFINKNKQNKGN